MALERPIHGVPGVTTRPTDLDVTYSNETERLVDLLAARLIASRQSPDSHPFAQATIAVPNLNLAQWIRFRLAERLGIAAGIDFLFLEKIFRRIILTYIPNARIVDKGLLQALLIEFFRTEPWRTNEKLAQVGRYLGTDLPEHRRQERSQRLFDLTSSLAKAFDDYAMSRRDLLTRWRKNQSVLPRENRSATTEVWQREIWRSLFMPEGYIDRLSKTQGSRMAMLGDLFSAALEIANTSSIKPATLFGSNDSVLHIFGFSYVASAYLEMLAQLAQHLPVRIYTLNPCQEYWEDVETLKEEHSRAKRFRVRSPKLAELDGDDPFLLNSAMSENLLLRLWGRPGRENIRVLNALTDCTFSEIFVNPEEASSSLLTQVRSALLFRQPTGSSPSRPDDSLVYLRCRGGVRREVETIACEIWRLIAESGDGPKRLRFNDIAIIVGASSKELYESAIQSAFDECHRLPFRMADASARSTSPIVDALFTLFDSCFSDINRSSLLRFLTHSAVVSRHQGDADIWTNLVEEAHIYIGAHAGDLTNTYIDKDVFNWDQGLLRLTLGACMSGERLGDTRAISVRDKQYLPTDSSPNVRRQTERFVVLARSLLADLDFLRTQSCNAKQWAEFFNDFMHTYLGSYSGESNSEADVRAACAQAAQDLAAFDCGSDSHFDGFTALQFFTENLARIKPGQAGFLADGVVVASFLPMRPIPFRVIFVVGMGEGKFPTADSLNALDLRSAKRRASDVSPREQDKYMFLETILSCREKLYVSWIARDEISGDAIEPSGIVKELNQALLEMGLTLEDLKKLERSIPHRRFDAKLFENEKSAEHKLPNMLFPEAWREYCATRGDYLPQNEQTKTSQRPSDRHTKQLVRMSVFELGRFLDNPLLATAANKFSIRNTEYEDPVDVASEPQESDRDESKRRVEESFEKAWFEFSNQATERRESMLATHRDAFNHAELAGAAPIGLMGETEFTAEQLQLTIMDDLLERLRETFAAPELRPISIGQRRGFEQSTTPPLRLSLPGDKTIELSAHVALAFVGNDSALLVSHQYGSGDELSLADELKLFLVLCIAIAAGQPFPASSILAVLPKTTPKSLDRCAARFKTPTMAEAQQWLTDIAEEWNERGHAYYLPAALVENKTLKPFLASQGESEQAAAQQVVEQVWYDLLDKDPDSPNNTEGIRLRKALGKLEPYAPPQQALSVLQKRLSLFLQQRSNATATPDGAEDAQ